MDHLSERSLVDRCVRSLKFGILVAAYVGCIGLWVVAAGFSLWSVLDLLAGRDGHEGSIFSAHIQLAWWFPFAGLAIGAVSAAGANFIAEIRDRMDPWPR